MADIEKLIKSIMADAEKDGEPLTYEEAKEVAEMEIKAKGIKRYEQTAEPKKKKTKERKVDNEKKFILNVLHTALECETDAVDFAFKNEVELSFSLNGNPYTLKLTKHRPPKNK